VHNPFKGKKINLTITELPEPDYSIAPKFLPFKEYDEKCTSCLYDGEMSKEYYEEKYHWCREIEYEVKFPYCSPFPERVGIDIIRAPAWYPSYVVNMSHMVVFTSMYGFQKGEMSLKYKLLKWTCCKCKVYLKTTLAANHVN